MLQMDWVGPDSTQPRSVKRRRGPRSAILSPCLLWTVGRLLCIQALHTCLHHCESRSVRAFLCRDYCGELFEGIQAPHTCLYLHDVRISRGSPCLGCCVVHFDRIQAPRTCSPLCDVRNAQVRQFPGSCVPRSCRIRVPRSGRLRGV